MRSVMKKAVLLMAFVVGVGGAASRAFAADVVVADVPFKFLASGKTQDAGKYELTLINDGQSVELTGPTKAGTFSNVITRLAAPAGGTVEARLVFDVVGDTFVLSEAWLPGQDGLLLQATKEAHTHRAVKLQKAAKPRAS